MSKENKRYLALLCACICQVAHASDMGGTGFWFAMFFVAGGFYSGVVYSIAAIVFIIPMRKKKNTNKKVAIIIPVIMVAILLCLALNSGIPFETGLPISSGAIVSVLLTTIFYIISINKFGKYQKQNA